MKLLVSAALLAISSLALVADAHISFRYPCPRRAPYSECPQPQTGNDWNLVDYDVQSPLGTYVSLTHGSTAVEWMPHDTVLVTTLICRSCT